GGPCSSPRGTFAVPCGHCARAPSPTWQYSPTPSWTRAFRSSHWDGSARVSSRWDERRKSSFEGDEAEGHPGRRRCQSERGEPARPPREGENAERERGEPEQMFGVPELRHHAHYRIARPIGRPLELLVRSRVEQRPREEDAPEQGGPQPVHADREDDESHREQRQWPGAACLSSVRGSVHTDGAPSKPRTTLQRAAATGGTCPRGMPERPGSPSVRDRLTTTPHRYRRRVRAGAGGHVRRTTKSVLGARSPRRRASGRVALVALRAAAAVGRGG